MNPLVSQVGHVLVHGGQRRQAEAPSDFLEARRVAVLLDELVEVVENFALSLGEGLHGRLLLGTLAKKQPKPRLTEAG